MITSDIFVRIAGVKFGLLWEPLVTEPRSPFFLLSLTVSAGDLSPIWSSPVTSLSFSTGFLCFVPKSPAYLGESLLLLRSDLGGNGGVVNQAHLIAVSLIGVVAAAGTHYRWGRRSRSSSAVEDQKIVPLIGRTESGHAGSVEKFSHYFGKFRKIQISVHR